MINNYTLFCRQCNATWQDINEQGVCEICETPNILESYKFSIEFPHLGYSVQEAIAQVTAYVKSLVDYKVLPEGSRVS